MEKAYGGGKVNGLPKNAIPNNIEKDSTDASKMKNFSPEKKLDAQAAFTDISEKKYDPDDQVIWNRELSNRNVILQKVSNEVQDPDERIVWNNVGEKSESLLESKTLERIITLGKSTDATDHDFETTSIKQNVVKKDTYPDVNKSEKIESNSSEGNAGEEDIESLKKTDLDKKDPVLEKIEKSLETPDGIKKLIERHPEKEELWKKELEALNVLNNPDASPAEIRSAQAKLSILKGQLLETAVKDALADVGFDVEPQQRVVVGENGGTRPDVIAVNNTDHPIEAFGVAIQPGETLSVECKCGCAAYMTNQLNTHIPNQLSGQEGIKILLTTSDIKDTASGLANSVCDRYGAKLIVAEVSVADVEKSIKEVSVS